MCKVYKKEKSAIKYWEQIERDLSVSLDNDRRMQRETIDCFITFLHEKWHDSLSDYQQSKSPTLPKEITDLKFHLRYTAISWEIWPKKSFLI